MYVSAVKPISASLRGLAGHARTVLSRIALPRRGVAAQARRDEWLASSDLTFRTVLEGIPAMTYVEEHVASNERDGNPALYVSRQLAEFFAAPSGEMTADPRWWYRHVHHEDRARTKAEDERTTQTGEPFSVDYRVTTDDGRVVWIHDEAVLLKDEDGRPHCWFGIVHDITDRKLAEEELVQAQKMEAIGRLAGGVAHDFNNMLTAIAGYASLGLETPGLSDELRHYFDEILHAASSSADLTRQLLTFTRKQVFQPLVLDLNDVVSGAEGMLARLIGEDVEIRVELGADVGHVRADPSQIDQVLVNLAVNARAAMPAGGTLTIQTLGADGDSMDRAPGAPPSAVLRVADTGVGMDEATRARAFEPFFTTRADGTGLGLSTVYAIVEQNDGHVRIDSEPERGTTFTITFPTVPATAVDLPRPAAPTGSLSGSETVLLVEDQAAVRDVARIALEGHGYRVLEADTPSSALRVVQEHAPAIDLVVTDVVLPEMNGKELVEAIRERLPRVDAVYVSGYAEDAIAHDGVLEPDVPFVAKPFSPDELATKVRAQLDLKPVDDAASTVPASAA